MAKRQETSLGKLFTKLLSIVIRKFDDEIKLTNWNRPKNDNMMANFKKNNFNVDQ